MLRQSKELENLTDRYCKNLGMVPSIVHCQVIQNDTQRGVLAHAHCKMGYIPKGGDSLVFSTIKFIMQSLSKEESEQSNNTFQECRYW